MKQRQWRSWGASVTGPSHIKRGLPNQDAWLSWHCGWGDVLVVSDGLGSRSRSDVGAQAACKAVIEAAKIYHKYPEAKVEDLLTLIHSIWLLKIGPYDPDECNATCLFVIRNGSKFVMAQLGDGMITLCSSKSDENILLRDGKEESFSNITHCLGHISRPEQWQSLTVESISCEAVVLCTDGISEDLLPEKQINFSSELYREYSNYSNRKRNKEIYKWLTNWPVPGHTDDKTIACLYKKRGF